MNDYDRRTKVAVAGSSFKDANKQLLDHLGDADSEISMMEGLIHYRLYDSAGKLRDRFDSNSLILTGDKVKKAKEAQTLLLEMRKGIRDVVQKRRKLERLEQWLDGNLEYY